MSPYEVTHEKVEGGYVLKATFLGQPEPITGYFHRDQGELVLKMAQELHKIAYKLSTKYVVPESPDRKVWYSTRYIFESMDKPYGYVIKFDDAIQNIWTNTWKDAQAAKDIAMCLMDILVSMMDYEGYWASLQEIVLSEITEPVLGKTEDVVLAEAR